MDGDLELDNTWVESYKNTENNYNDFYNKKVTNIKVFYLYVNTENTIVNIKKEIMTLKNAGIITKEQIITMIKENKENKYKLLSLIKYNINLLPEEINDFINTNNDYTKRFFTLETYIKDIYFTDTISIFQDLNALYCIFKETIIHFCTFTPLHNSNMQSNSYNTLEKYKCVKKEKFTKKLRANIKKNYTKYKR